MAERPTLSNRPAFGAVRSQALARAVPGMELTPPSMPDTQIYGSALTRQLGTAAVTALVIGEVIGVGIFLTPAGMARSLGSPFWLLVDGKVPRAR